MATTTTRPELRWPGTGAQSSALHKRFFRWLAENPLPAVTLAGFVVYGAARLSYISFYSTFGVESEDVGVTYGVTLARAAAGFGALLLVVGLLVLVVFLVVELIHWISDKRRGHGVEHLRSIANKETLAVLLTVLTFIFIVGMPESASKMADDVKAGKEIVPSLGIRDRDLLENPLGFRAEHVQIRWVEESTPDAPPLPDGSTVTYLGRSGDTIVLYDFTNDETLRVPASLVILTNRDNE